MEANPTGHLRTLSQGKVLHVIIDRQAKRNAIDLGLAEALLSAVIAFGDSDEHRVLLVRAEGKYFSAGADINGDMFPQDEILKTSSKFRRWYRRGRGSLHPLLDEIEALEKPVVVAHQGPCLGGALELSLACDFRLASSEARYALPETTLGSIPGSGGLSRTTRLVGQAWAKWLIMANLPITAEKAERIGLVHEMYPAEEFTAKVDAFCNHLASQPPEVLAAAKLAIRLVADLGPGQARDVERLATSVLVAGPEYEELVSALRAKLRKGGG